MIHADDLNAIRQFAIQQPVRKWINTAAAHRRFQQRPPFRIPANSVASFLNGIHKKFSHTRLFFIVKTYCIGQFDLRDGEKRQPFHFAFRYASRRTSAASRSVNSPASNARQLSSASRFHVASISGELSSGSKLNNNFSTSDARSFVGNESASIK